MLVACRLAGLSALEGHYADVDGFAQSGHFFFFKKKKKKKKKTLYAVRPHACASIFHSSPRFENV